jgi:hypothetical protein
MKLHEVDFRVVDLVDGAVVLASTYQSFTPTKRMAVNDVRLFIMDFHPLFIEAIEPEIQIDAVRRVPSEYREDEMLVLIGGGVGGGAYPAGPSTELTRKYPHGTYLLVSMQLRWIFWVDHWHGDHSVVGYAWSSERGWSAQTSISAKVILGSMPNMLTSCTESERRAYEEALQEPPN